MGPFSRNLSEENYSICNIYLPYNSIDKKMSTQNSFTYLYIPNDDTKDIEERTLTYSSDNEIGCLTQTLRDHFVQIQGNKSAAEVQSTMYSALQAEAAQKGIDITDDNKAKILEQLAQSQMVDIVPLQMATSSNGWTAVSLYVDDKGVNKGVALNVRATKLSVACGRPVRVMGDAFVARAQDDNRDLYKRGNILKSDFAPNAAWVVEANRATTGGGSGSGAVVSKKKAAPVDSARLEKYAAQLETWVSSKLKQWDEDEVFRKERTIKYESKEKFEAYLRSKVDKKMASFNN